MYAATQQPLYEIPKHARTQPLRQPRQTTAEAKQALNQARAACPDMHLVLGAMPLGHAFALTVGWAEAIGEHPFTIRGSRELTKGTRPDPPEH